VGGPRGGAAGGRRADGGQCTLPHVVPCFVGCVSCCVVLCRLCAVLCRLCVVLWRLCVVLWRLCVVMSLPHVCRVVGLLCVVMSLPHVVPGGGAAVSAVSCCDCHAVTWECDGLGSVTTML
jgi:hypothetical protein